MPDSRESPGLLAAVAFGGVLALAVAVFALAAWLEGFAGVFRADPSAWWSQLDREAAGG